VFTSILRHCVTRYNCDHNLDLIRLIRNQHTHKNGVKGFSPEIKTLYDFKTEIHNKIDKTDVDVTDKQFLGFWTQCDLYPSLLIDTWKFLERWKNELGLQAFYPSDYSFSGQIFKSLNEDEKITGFWYQS